MASPVSLEAPPMQPPGIQAGGPMPPMAAVGGMLADKQGAPPENSKGAVLALWQTIQKAMDKMASMAPEVQPFVARMNAVGESMLQALSDNKPGTDNTPTPAGSAAPAGVGVGEGFPG